ncbi:hypothetical protein M2317_000073 [Microbacterium sp. ZKA21]|uniref:hypothetical protein n=1 Tax=Microbacterium sp. ZKA21 TaxID=3381694 RepID=UPI003D2244FE
MIENGAAFATVTAQIFPVLMLTLVVEWRARARWMTGKRRVNVNRGLRWWTALVYAACAISLFVGFHVALTGVIEGELSPVGALVIYATMLLAVLLLFLNPMISIAVGLSFDSAPRLILAFPLSKPARALRRRAREQDWARSVLRRRSSDRLTARGEIAAAYIELYKRLPAYGPPLSFKTRTILAGYERSLEAAQDSLNEWQRDADDLAASIATTTDTELRRMIEAQIDEQFDVRAHVRAQLF